MSDDYSQDVLKIADDIVKYLSTRKEAADTLEGVIKWWLLRQRIEDESEKVQGAIDYLCDLGVIKEVKMHNGECVYVSNASQFKGANSADNGRLN